MILTKVILYARLCMVPLLISACVKENQQPVVINQPTPVDTITQPPADLDTTIITWLALGDSYTIGQGVQPQERYPAQTTEKLKQHGISTRELRYIATSGWTTLNLQSAIATQNPVGPYGIVTLLIGVNDQYQGRDSSGYRYNFTVLLNKSIELAGGVTQHVFVLSVPDYSVTPFGGGSVATSTQIDLFNSINKEITLSYGIEYINVTELSREMGNDAGLIADGLHPSGKEYEKWAGLLADAINKVY
ncbi:SGNH/GDSL hydrolase family protein [soil metagenome]